MKLFNILRKSIDFPDGKLVAFNIDAREFRVLLQRFIKKDRKFRGYFELVPSTVKELLNEKD